MTSLEATSFRPTHETAFSIMLTAMPLYSVIIAGYLSAILRCFLFIRVMFLWLYFLKHQLKLSVNSYKKCTIYTVWARRIMYTRLNIAVVGKFSFIIFCVSCTHVLKIPATCAVLCFKF